MSYTVLARKYRSKTFDEIVGQDAIATTLKNAISCGRIHHGYLFTGTRGVGKTSMARILAKALNCQSSDGPVTVPCCECDSCVSIAQGNDMDVIEIDAASNTGVDNIRDLRDNANYRPARSRFKICIIDEVHMLSIGAFNALLKTLEEPPGHVKFIFATTDPQKIPATVLSRVQRFDFRSISTDLIAKHLVGILEQEQIQADEAVVRRIARLANGSMRDSLSLLDQLLSLGDQRLTVQLIDEVLPAPHDEILAELIDQVAVSDAAAALGTVERSLAQGHTLERFCEALINQMRTLMLLAVCGAETELVDVPAGLRERLVKQSGSFDAATYVYIITLLEELRRNVRFSGSGRALTDAAIVKLCEAEKFSSIEALLAQAKGESAAVLPPSARSGSANRQTASQAFVQSAAAAKKKDDAPPVSRSAPPPLQVQSTPQSAPVAPPASVPPPPAPRRASSVSSADKQAALKDPAVQKAMDLFNGDLVNVERLAPPQDHPAEALE